MKKWIILLITIVGMVACTLLVMRLWIVYHKEETVGDDYFEMRKELYEEAQEVLDDAKKPLDSREVLSASDLNVPATNYDDQNQECTTWDCIYFGNYWQNKYSNTNEDDDKEPIKWRVLSIKGNDVFLLADKNLDIQPYNDFAKELTWEKSTLRKWLNEDFFNNAFSEKEREAILTTEVENDDSPEYGTDGGKNTKDKIYLLSIEEVQNTDYGFESRIDGTGTRESTSTDFVEAKIKNTLSSGESWWLRSPGICDDHGTYISYIYGGGSINIHGNYSSDEGTAVRPAMHLDLSATSAWSYAGTVNGVYGD